MSFFKEIYCTESGKKTHLLTRTKLCDGNYLCSECTSIVPSYMMNSFCEKYTLEDYRDLKEYIKYSNEHLRPIFHGTHCFYSLHIDTENLLFYIGYGIDSDTIFLNFQNVTRFDMIFSAEEYKDGILGTKVNGKIMLELGMDCPYFYHEEVLTKNAKAKAKKSLFGTKIEYDNPDGMDDFMFYFQRSWREALEQAEGDDCDCEDNSVSELQQAMALFMIDSLDEITPESLKSLRNKLIKTFHPDTGAEEDTKHAQKINAAYEIIKNALKK